MVPQHSTVEAGPEIYVEHNDVLVLPMSNGISGCLGDNGNDKHSIGSIVTGKSNALFNGKEDSSSAYPDRMHCTPTFGNDSSTSAVSISDGRGLRGLPINLGTVYMTGVTRTPTLKASTKKRAISATRHSSRIAKPCADSIENESSLSNKERRSSLGDVSDATNGKSVSTPKNGNSGDDPVPQPSASSSSGFKTIGADSTTPLEDDLANSSKKTVATAVPSAVNVLNGNGISSQHPNTTAKHSTGPVNTTMPVTPIVHQGFVQPTNPIIDGSTGFYPIPVNPFSSNAQSSVGASNFQWGYIPGPNGGLSLVPYSVVGSSSMIPSMPIGVTGTNTTDVGHELQQPSTQGPLSLDRYQNGTPAMGHLGVEKITSLLHLANMVPAVLELLSPLGTRVPLILVILVDLLGRLLRMRVQMVHATLVVVKILSVPKALSLLCLLEGLRYYLATANHLVDLHLMCPRPV
ncbi:hypothetical protein Pmar_PMAR023269 [Perkinsus marinus ATCC 50983]|uniref:Uncharacterized protein n=1 Tax=Perkinsus marinus (strain ATCC 50983 / TXsc) TaxID=423536 RepID=C5KK33_PERM5|nr:hypothetical protein Pmar_PMAR023269 [Perkinsus marinus ATCC 50983]EER14945.1 hypothetical protein Pmar_PMAR023269 [Perkinsus marinus ATCC 50983]|eukprot:XP_002783149.1 hypothetical protein Pmar_PMAR023269 [Perkinsus marinus ATCC 50983]